MFWSGVGIHFGIDEQLSGNTIEHLSFGISLVSLIIVVTVLNSQIKGEHRSGLRGLDFQSQNIAIITGKVTRSVMVGDNL